MNLAELFQHATDLVKIKAGEAVFRHDERGDVMYVLMSGKADILVGSVVVENAESGAILGEMALIEQTPRTATVLAVTDCQLLPIDVKRFHFLIQQTPHFASHVMKVMAERLRKMDQRLLEGKSA